MPKVQIVFCFLFLIIGAIAFSSCSADLEPPPAIPKDSSGSPAAPGGSKLVEIKSIDGRLVAEIDSEGQIAFGGKRLTRKRKNSEKVTYLLDGTPAAEVKAKDLDTFKVRDLNGNLIWKVKIQKEKVKISDNEENLNPFEIKKNYDGAKVRRSGQKLGEIKIDSKANRVRVKNSNEEVVFESRTDRFSFGFGVLVLESIPETQRFIIMAELFSRGL